MKIAVIILSVFVLFTQCTENEPKNIILPKLVSVSASLLENDVKYRVEFTGTFNDGQDPVKEIKIAWSRNMNIDKDPRGFSIGKSAQFLDSHTFKVEFETDPYGVYYVAFNFISENTATYSETYSFSVVKNKPVFEQVFPEKK
jgi:hypothetical protein